MGQYYRIVLKQGNKKPLINDFGIEGMGARDWIGIKLLEHAYYGNDAVDAVAQFITRHPTRIIWCGDYAEDEEIKALTKGKLSYEDVYPKEYKQMFVLPRVKGTYNYKSKYLINHDKKLFVSLLKAKKESQSFPEDTNPISPIPLLTALGNGRGSGDYEGVNMELVGTWAWDRIEILGRVPEGYTELNVKFIEG